MLAVALPGLGLKQVQCMGSGVAIHKIAICGQA